MAEQDPWRHAQVFVGNDREAYFVAGICQLEILKRSGLQRHHHVLEVGCGALVGGRPVMQHLHPDRYVGIEPNTWLVEAAIQHLPDMPGTLVEKRPVFLDNLDFDASGTGRRFDFVLSHSILSHAAHHQLDQFLAALARDMALHGVALVSARLRDEHGTLMPDSMFDDWQYPGVSYFTMATIADTARRHGLLAEEAPEFRSFMTRHVPSNHHDWIRIRRFAAGVPPQRPQGTYEDPHYRSTAGAG